MTSLGLSFLGGSSLDCFFNPSSVLRVGFSYKFPDEDCQGLEFAGAIGLIIIQYTFTHLL